jgi:hypothetical protein
VDNVADNTQEQYETLVQRYYAAHERAQRAPLGSTEYQSAMNEVRAAHSALAALSPIDEASDWEDEPPADVVQGSAP